MATPAERAQAIITATAGRQAGFSVRRGNRRLVFDQPPTAVRNKAGEVVGVEVMVRLFQGATEIHIDPHRVILNPPTVPRANLTWEVGAYDTGVDVEARWVGTGEIVAARLLKPPKGLAYRRIVGAPDPEAAIIEAIWDSIETVPNAKGFRTRGTVTTVFATAPGGNGSVVSVVSGTYETARTTADSAQNNHRVGQFVNLTPVYQCYEGFIIFDTSAIPDDDTVSAVTASLDGNSDGSNTDFTAKIAADDYDGGAVVTGDWISGASLNALTVLATWASSGYSSGYNAFTESGSNFADAINKTGNTAIIVFSNRHADGTVPTTNVTEWVIFTDADDSGTTADPKLDITHAAAAGVVGPLIGGRLVNNSMLVGGRLVGR